MKVNRMSLELAAFGQRAAMQAKLAGFRRIFSADIHRMVVRTLHVGLRDSSDV